MTPGNPSAAFPPFPETSPFDPARHADFLGAIQGNILKGHGRKHTRLLFVRFHSQRTDPGALFRAALERRLITSAAEQKQQTLSGDRSQGFFSLLLTKEFFFLFRRPFPPETIEAFRGGAYVRMGGRAGTTNWEPVYRRHPHGIWLLAHESKTGLQAMTRAVRQLASEHHVRILRAREEGLRWHDEHDPKALREPFGFRDGISQSAFLLPETAAHPAVQLPLAQVLIPHGDHAGGSYFVLQKLEQNVSAFRLFETRLAEQLAAQPAQPPPVRSPGALLVGRERDGTPLAKGHPQPTNDFNFSADPSGGRCPFHAHIRKANPRGDTPLEDAASVLSRQFVRRGVVYDTKGQLPLHASPDYAAGDRITGDVGLLFMGYMSDVSLQFEHMRLSWLENPDFPSATDQMPDPVLNRRENPVRDWQWTMNPDTNPPTAMKVEGMPRFVTSRGAVFCYAPSLAWLRRQ